MVRSKRYRGIIGSMLLLSALIIASCTTREQTGLATNPPGHSVTLHWDASPSAKFYNVYRSTTSKSGYQRIGTTPTPSYKDAPVPSGSIFYYVVTAVSDKGESKFSSEIKAVVP